MNAIAVYEGTDEPVVTEKPRPEPAPGEALVRTLRVGVDGTDHEVIDGGNVWEYTVHRSGRDGNLGTTADLETAKQVAFAFMNESVANV